MHEVSIATDLIERAVRAAEDHDADRIDSLTVAVGRATHLNPTQLTFAIETVATGTVAEEATIDIERVDPHAECSCGWEGTPETLDMTQIVAPNVTCPECGNRLEFTAGRECRLKNVSVPDTPRNPALTEES